MTTFVGSFLGDDATTTPALPDGYGAVVVRYWFTSHVELRSAEQVVNDRPNYDIWVPPPVLLVDRQPARASWSTWCYPLPAGDHEIAVTEPAPATRQVHLAPGTVEHLDYKVTIVYEKDHLDSRVLGSRPTGGFTA